MKGSILVTLNVPPVVRFIDSLVELQLNGGISALLQPLEPQFRASESDREVVRPILKLESQFANSHNAMISKTPQKARKRWPFVCDWFPGIATRWPFKTTP
jgi:hypothetical protein